MDEGTIIYSQKFPQPDIPDFSGPELTEEEQAEFDAWYSQRLEELKNSVYDPIPGREEESKQFIARAEELSRRYHLDTEITQYADGIRAAITTGHCVFSGGLLRQLAELLGMCDRVITYCPGDGGLEHTLFLQFNTHELRIK